MKSLLVRIRRMDAYALFTDTSAELKSKILALRDEASLVLDLDSLTHSGGSRYLYASRERRRGCNVLDAVSSGV